MSIDNIILPFNTIQKLYPTGIINLEKKITTDKKILFKGKNHKHVLVLIDIVGDLKATEEELLNNLIKACKLTIDDIALVNLREQEVSVPEMIAQLKTQKAIFFGVPHGAIKLSVKDADEQLLQAADCTIVKTLPLSNLNNDIERKKALWSALKQQFNL
ncbi:MAG: hypothetical protein J5I50_00530 [Chitinophagaceae bacterium]|nr:hypothetical protein [Chitinophagaceae bacterium]